MPECRGPLDRRGGAYCIGGRSDVLARMPVVANMTAYYRTSAIRPALAIGLPTGRFDAIVDMGNPMKGINIFPWLQRCIEGRVISGL